MTRTRKRYASANEKGHPWVPFARCATFAKRTIAASSSGERQRFRQIARRHCTAGGEGGVAMGNTFERRQIVKARDKAQDRR